MSEDNNSIRKVGNFIEVDVPGDDTIRLHIGKTEEDAIPVPLSKEQVEKLKPILDGWKKIHEEQDDPV